MEFPFLDMSLQSVTESMPLGDGSTRIFCSAVQSTTERKHFRSADACMSFESEYSYRSAGYYIYCVYCVNTKTRYRPTRLMQNGENSVVYCLSYAVTVKLHQLRKSSHVRRISKPRDWNKVVLKLENAGRAF